MPELPELPEFDTTSLGRERAAHAAAGTLTLQTCRECGQPQYPCRHVCGHCLSGELSWSRMRPEGRVIATALVHASQHPFFRPSGPWRICSVRLEAGPRVIAHACDSAIESGVTVEVSDRRISETHCVLVAKLPAGSAREKEKT